MIFKSILGAIAGLILFGGAARADSFDAIKCGADIPKLLRGKSFGGEETAVAFENRHKAIGLTDNWAEIVSDKLQTVSLTMCGSEYYVLVDDKNVMRDVVRFPAHSRALPAFGGICRVGGKETPWAVYAVLDNKAHVDPNPEHHFAMDDKTELPALFAWRVDEVHAKYVAVPAKGLGCPRSGVITMDGGL